MEKKITSFLIYFFYFYIIIIISLPPLPIFSKEEIDNGYFKETSEILVRFKNDENVHKINIKWNQDFNEILENYRQNINVLYAEPNYLYNASAIPNDNYYNNQWYLEKIKAPKAWDKINSSPNIIIAVIDSGIQINHPDLIDNIWENSDEVADNGIDDDKNGFIDDIHGWDFINNSYDPSPKFEDGFTEAGILHGTMVAGVLAASGNNNIGITGITWKSKIMALRVLDDKGEGRASEVIRAIDYAINNGVDIINLSFVGFGYSKALEEAVRRAYNAGIVIIAAAGNDQDEGDGYFLDETPMYPACHDGENGENMVIGVVATDTIDQKASFSSHGFKCVDIAAPGISIFSTSVYEPQKSIGTKVFNKYYDGYWSGTSMAAPMVSGALALIEEVNLRLNRDEVVDILLNSVDDISRLNPNYLGQLGKGRLNIAEAVNLAYKNINNNIIVKLLLAPNKDYISKIKIVDVDGNLESEFNSYGDNFLGGAYISSGDVNGDGDDEIITGAGNGGGPQVRIFNDKGDVLGQFFAYNSNFRGGVRVAVADIDSKVAHKKAEIITAAGPGGGPHVRIFNDKGDVLGQFFAYNSNFRGGISIAASDVDNDGLAEIVTGAGPGGTPHVRVFESNGKIIGSFYAYEDDFSGGVNVGVIRVKK